MVFISCEIALRDTATGRKYGVWLIGPDGVGEVKKLRDQYVNDRREIIAVLGTKGWKAISPDFFQLEAKDEQAAKAAIDGLMTSLSF